MYFFIMNRFANVSNCRIFKILCSIYLFSSSCLCPVDCLSFVRSLWAFPEKYRSVVPENSLQRCVAEIQLSLTSGRNSNAMFHSTQGKLFPLIFNHTESVKKQIPRKYYVLMVLVNCTLDIGKFKSQLSYGIGA